MNHPTVAIQPPLDLETMWQNSLIRVSDQLTIPPVVSVSMKPSLVRWATLVSPRARQKPRRLSMFVPLWQLAHQWTSARISGFISRKQTRHPLFRYRTKSLLLPTSDATHLVLSRASLRPRT